MNKQADYPLIGSLKGMDAPYQILNKIKSFSNLTETIKDNTVTIESYKTNFWGFKKKSLEVTITRIDNADEQTKTFDPNSNGKVFGIVVIQNDKKVYKALFDCGVYKSCIDTVLNNWNEQGKEALYASDFNTYNICNAQYNLTESHYSTLKLIEQLFELAVHEQ